jgi:phosphoglycolate phosphatase-like HAD superfamily hydrolase
MEKPLLLLDFDGVIADTFRIGHSVAQKVCSFITETDYRAYHEENIVERIRKVRATDHGDRCDHALDWLGEYLPEFNLHAKPFAEMPELLREFSKTYRLIIVSSTHNDLIRAFLHTYRMQDGIEDVYGLETNARKDEKFRAIFAKYDIAPEQTIFVTDTLGDINEATTVDLRSIGVTWGFQDRHTLSRGNPFRIVDTPQELPKAVSDYFASAT